MAGYYCHFIENLSKISKHMMVLLKKNTKYVWSPTYETSFQEFKTNLTSTPILVLLDASKNFDIYCDASKQGLGYVLMQ